MDSTSIGNEAKPVSVRKRSRGFLACSGLLISAVTLVLCLGAIELAGFIWERNTAQGPLGWTLVASRRLNLESHGDPEKPYDLFLPNDDYLWEGIPVHINSYGFRTDEFDVSKPVGTYRILNLGDSVVFGWEARQEDTYGKFLENLLNKRENGLNYEVINAGIPAWDLKSERNFLLQEGLDYQPDLVILDLTVVNDLASVMNEIANDSPAITGGGGFFPWLRDHTFSWPFLTTQVRFLLAKQRGPEAIPVLNPYRNADAYFPLEEDSEVWEHAWAYVTEMHQAVQERSVDFVVVVFPTALQLNSAAHPDLPQRVLREKARQDGITLIDLLPIYSQVCASAGPDACEGFENLLFVDVWMHPTQLGHKLAAEALEKVIP